MESARFDVAAPTEDDAARISAIHLAAMGPNSLLHAQFPTAESLGALEAFLAERTAAQLRAPAPRVHVARDRASREIVGFVKWEPAPGAEQGGRDDDEPAEWPASACRRYLDEYAALAAQAKERALGGRPCYSVSFVCVDPAWQGRGAGSLLTRRVLEDARGAGAPVYLESTPGAAGMYRRLGFAAVDGLRMVIPRRGAAGLTETYEEVCMLWSPPPPRP